MSNVYTIWCFTMIEYSMCAHIQTSAWKPTQSKCKLCILYIHTHIPIWFYLNPEVNSSSLTLVPQRIISIKAYSVFSCFEQISQVRFWHVYQIEIIAKKCHAVLNFLMTKASQFIWHRMTQILSLVLFCKYSKNYQEIFHLVAIYGL